MAKDLDLHEHCSEHASGEPCGLTSAECLVQTRVWQTLLVVETMIGAPQGICPFCLFLFITLSFVLFPNIFYLRIFFLGRSDFGVDPESVEVRPAWGTPNLERFEIERSRHFCYFVRNVLNIRLMTDAYHRIKKQKDWGADSRLVQNNPRLDEWLASLPPDLQASYPPDGSPALIPSHFVGNMHSHFHLGIIMLHRPQLLASKSFAAGGEWRTHMSLCYESAKSLCRLQEAVLESYDLSGLLYMQRGINFTIYCILTCTMLHLVSRDKRKKRKQPFVFHIRRITD